MQASMGMSQQSSCGHHSCITRKEIKMKARTKKTPKVADKENVTVEIYEASEMPSGVKDFLFQSDCAGNISRSACMALYERIHNYDNNIAYGFRIVKDSFGNLIRQELGFQDFVELIKECIDTNCDLLWS